MKLQSRNHIKLPLPFIPWDIKTTYVHVLSTYTSTMHSTRHVCVVSTKLKLSSIRTPTTLQMSVRIDVIVLYCLLCDGNSPNISTNYPPQFKLYMDSQFSMRHLVSPHMNIFLFRKLSLWYCSCAQDLNLCHTPCWPKLCPIGVKYIHIVTDAFVRWLRGLGAHTTPQTLAPPLRFF